MEISAESRSHFQIENSPARGRSGRDASPARRRGLSNRSNSPIRGRRVRSLDCSPPRRSDSFSDESMNNIRLSVGKDDVRSLSTGDSSNIMLMKSLNFEKTELGNTPLSSLRSCSEYNRWSLHPTEPNSNSSDQKSTSFYGYVVSFFYTPKTKPKNRVRFQDSCEDQVFLISNLRFNEANLLEGEDYNYRSESSGQSNSSSSSSSSFRGSSGSTGGNSSSQKMRSSSILSASASFLGMGSSNSSNTYSSSGAGGSGIVAGGSERRTSGDSRNSSTDSTACSSRKKKKRSSSSRVGSSSNNSTGLSIMEESLHTLEFIFGFGPRNKDMPMEIELREFSPPQVLAVYTEDINGIVPSIDNTHVHHDEATGIRRVTSLGTFGRLRSESTDSSSYPSRPSTPRSGMGVAVIPRFDLYNRDTWRPYFECKFFDCRDLLRFRYAMQFRSEDFFYECIRIQPFSSGSYMRAMLVAGFCSTLFNVYNTVSWPHIADMTLVHKVVVGFLYLSLNLQTLVNVIQLPLRLQVHFQCWEAARVIEVDRAIDVIRRMLSSDSWLFNRMLGFGLDLSTMSILFITELYLWLAPYSDPLRPLVISLGATNLMTIVMRVAVATIFALSMHDPQVLSEARRRGLSKWDLAVLPAFVFSNPNDVNNLECSICLGAFEMGEMLTSLPCDKKHSFHSACIRQWLERQNSCPLCQKMV